MKHLLFMCGISLWVLIILFSFIVLRNTKILSHKPMWDRKNIERIMDKKISIFYWLYVMIVNTILYFTVPENVTLKVGKNPINLNEGLFFIIFLVSVEVILFIAIFKKIKMETMQFLGIYLGVEETENVIESSEEKFALIAKSRYHELILELMVWITSGRFEITGHSLIPVLSNVIDILNHYLDNEHAFITDIKLIDNKQLKKSLQKQDYDEIREGLKTSNNCCLLTNSGPSTMVIAFNDNECECQAILIIFDVYAIINIIDDQTTERFKEEQAEILMQLINLIILKVKGDC